MLLDHLEIIEKVCGLSLVWERYKEGNATAGGQWQSSSSLPRIRSSSCNNISFLESLVHVCVHRAMKKNH